MFQKVNVYKGSIDGETVIYTSDVRGEGGAFHEYSISPIIEFPMKAIPPAESFAYVKFQNGPVPAAGINGCTQEDLLMIVLHRLKCFQEGDFPCHENALAIEHVKSALDVLNERTRRRISSGIEGKNVGP